MTEYLGLLTKRVSQILPLVIFVCLVCGDGGWLPILATFSLPEFSEEKENSDFKPERRYNKAMRMMLRSGTKCVL